ncbi:MAG TPA: AsmA-like C-terminal region-containing protein, partial [Burkholderiales bacterium]|nr:AsmA-like C-terminal region-containing protein [Burkholderiales bacterium]
RLGRLELVASNDVRDWRIERLVLAAPEATFSADGTWQSWAARPSISLNIKLDVSDAGKFMDRMGFPKTLRGGTAKLEGRVGWAGSPQSLDYGTLTGNLSLSAQRGQFLKADPGVAKLLGVLSLQSLASLDLRSLFSEGFAYDSIEGTAVISKGVLNTEDFRMQGAPAQVSMKGSVDLAKETQNLHMRVVPALGGGASTLTAVALANPALVLLLPIINKILKDPLGQIFALEYDVTGNWNDPKVQRTKVDAPAAQSAAQ